jgi:hypothetical protein
MNIKNKIGHSAAIFKAAPAPPARQKLTKMTPGKTAGPENYKFLRRGWARVL